MIVGETPDQYLTRYCREYAPWLGGVAGAARLEAALRQAQLGHDDDNVFAGTTKAAKFAREVFGFVFGRPMSGRLPRRMALLAEAPFAFSPEFLSRYEECRYPTAAEIAERQQAEAARLAECEKRSAEYERDPANIARRAEAQRLRQLREDLGQALSRVAEHPDYEVVSVRTAIKRSLVVIPWRQVEHAGVCAFGSRSARVIVGTTLYQMKATDEVRTLPQAAFLALIEPFREVWTDAMKACEVGP